MDALVIGAQGQVGRALMRLLPAMSLDAVGTVHRRPGPNMEPLDIADHAAVRNVVARHRPALVFLPAALTAVDYCESHEDEAWEINVRGPEAVARAAADVGAKTIFFSSEYVFDGTAGPYGEDDPISPQGAYARSKAAGEEAVRATTDDHLIARTTVVFGWDPTSKNFAMQVWERLSAGQPMRVPHDQISNPTLAEFLALATILMGIDDVRGTVNVVGQDRLARSDLAVRLAQRLGLDAGLIEPVSTADLGQIAPRPLNAGLKTEKLASLLGRPAMPLDEAIETFVHRARTGLPE